jgi:O-antigen/teichoic acid export membrane protein
VLIGKGKPYVPVLSLAVGVIIKETLNLTLLKIPSINIYGGAIALIACYFVICLINLISTLTFKVNYERENAYSKEYAN